MRRPNKKTIAYMFAVIITIRKHRRCNRAPKIGRVLLILSKTTSDFDARGTVGHLVQILMEVSSSKQFCNDFDDTRCVSEAFCYC